MAARREAWRGRMARVRAQYRLAHGREPDLLHPRRYTEKIQWRKLFDPDPRFAVFCDKMATRALVARQFGPGLLTPLLWSGGPQPDLPPLDRIEPPYILKSSHASGHLLRVGRGETPDPALVRAAAREWLGCDYSAVNGEPAYAAVPRRLMVERLLAAADGGPVGEMRAFVFDGRVRILNTVLLEQGRLRNGAFHTPAWQQLDWHFSREVPGPFPRPVALDAMIAVAERLGAGTDHVRVDFLHDGPRLWVGEVTVYPWSGFARFAPDAADHALGALWRLRWPRLRAARALLGRPPGADAGEAEAGEAEVGEVAVEGAGPLTPSPLAAAPAPDMTGP